MTRAPERWTATGWIRSPAATVSVSLIAFLLAGCGGPVGPTAETLALVGVTLIDGTESGPSPNRTIVVRDGRIASISEGEPPPPDARVVDAAGLWVIPGLIDTHAHMPPPALQDRFLRTMLSFGITTARSTAAAPPAGVELRGRIETGEQVGPRFLTAGRLIDGPETIWDGFASVVESEAEIREEVARQSALGVDFIKLYVGLPPDVVAAGIDASHAAGIPVIGHLGRTPWPDAVDAGIDGLTHSCFWGMAHSLVPEHAAAEFEEMFMPNVDGFDPGMLSAWAQTMSLADPAFRTFVDAAALKRVTIDPNLVLCEAVIRGDDPETFDRLATALDVLPAPFPHPFSEHWSAADRDAAKIALDLFVQMIAEFHRSGIVLTLGTDTMNPWMTPGAAAHRELELLAGAGIPAADVIRIATRNGAEALGVLDETGTIAAGKAADLLVLGSDPLADISNVRDIKYVIRAGRAFEPAELRPDIP